jgi:hypothetical protein
MTFRVGFDLEQMGSVQIKTEPLYYQQPALSIHDAWKISPMVMKPRTMITFETSFDQSIQPGDVIDLFGHGQTYRARVKSLESRASPKGATMTVEALEIERDSVMEDLVADTMKEWASQIDGLTDKQLARVKKLIGKKPRDPEYSMFGITSVELGDGKTLQHHNGFANISKVNQELYRVVSDLGSAEPLKWELDRFTPKTILILDKMGLYD